VIYKETYDVTTIGASTPVVDGESMGIKMVLSGEGADELLGYLYFHKAPNAREFHKKMFVN
jgi:asparagine synthase (glutamine-hydrolysing)